MLFYVYNFYLNYNRRTIKIVKDITIPATKSLIFEGSGNSVIVIF